MDTSDSPPVHEIILSDRSESDSPDPYVGLPPMSPEQRGTFDSWSPQKQANYRQEWLQNAQQQSGQGQVDSRVMTPVRGEFGVGAVNGGSHPQVQMEVDEQPTVRDAEAFAAKHMPDLGQEVEDFKVHTWRIKNWQAQDKRIVSDSFEAGGHKWRILLFPYGNASGSTNDMTSIYLDYADPTGQKEGWHACAQFALAISNPNDPSIYTVSHAHHRFVAEECDWGFTRFADLRKLYSPTERGRATIENNEVEVTAFVRVLKDPLGTLWHSFLSWDSRQQTGYVGLKNQGATCYMNSFLQHAFVTTALKAAVFQIPTTDDDPNQSLALALQRLFYQLTTSSDAVSTQELTRSFGWSSADAFTQHDCQEFARILEDKLEDRMKGTIAEGTIPKLLKGKMKSYIRCVDIEYESSRVEEFYDLQLSVKGLNNLEDSFKDYISTETLDGDNKYQVEGRGLQKATKGVVFEELPPLLHLHLRRFEYSFETDAMAKINDRFEFPLSIDLAPYLSDDSPQKNESQVYNLHGVLVHSGDVTSGHYWSLLRPTTGPNWYKYDDDRVIPVLPQSVFEESFGGDLNNGLPGRQQQQRRTGRSFTSAYFLIYIRETAVSEILRPYDLNEIPMHIITRLQAEKEAAEAKRREREEQHLYLTVKIVTDETFSQHNTFDMAVMEEKNFPASNLPTFRLMKTETLAEFRDRLSAHFQIPKEELALYAMVGRQNRTFRVDAPLGEDQQSQTMEQIRTAMTSRSADLRLYLCHIPAHSKKPGPNDILLFLKRFDVEKQAISGAGHAFLDRNAKVGDLVPQICASMSWDPHTPVKLYEEIKVGMIENLSPRATLSGAELQTGDVVCFTIALSEKEQQDYEARGMIATVPGMYDWLAQVTRVVFKPKFEDAHGDNPTFTLLLSRKSTFDAVVTKLGEELRYDPLKLRLTTSATNGTPRNVVKRSLNPSLSELINGGYYNSSPSSPLLFYEKLDVELAEIEIKRAVRLHWVDEHNRVENKDYDFLEPKTSTFEQLAESLRPQIKLSENGSGKIRIFDISHDGRLQKIQNPAEMLGNLKEPAELYAEEVPLEEEQLDDRGTVVSVFHYHREPSRWHGVPFRFVLHEGEKVADMSKRLQQKLGVADKDWARYKIVLIQEHGFKSPTALADDDVLTDHRFQQGDCIALDHVDKAPRRNVAPAERAIVIR